VAGTLPFYPPDVASRYASVRQLRKSYVILGLVQQARISGGKAAHLLGLTRSGFLALMTRKGIPQIRLEPEEWDAEADRLRASQQFNR